MNSPLNMLAAYFNAWMVDIENRSERGATATEYALIIAGIALVIVSAVTTFGNKLGAVWTDITGKLVVGN